MRGYVGVVCVLAWAPVLCLADGHSNVTVSENATATDVVTVSETVEPPVETPLVPVAPTPTPTPATPAPVTPTPVTPAPVTPAPATPAPKTVATPAPTVPPPVVTPTPQPPPVVEVTPAPQPQGTPSPPETPAPAVPTPSPEVPDDASNATGTDGNITTTKTLPLMRTPEPAETPAPTSAPPVTPQPTLTPPTVEASGVVLAVPKLFTGEGCEGEGEYLMTGVGADGAAGAPAELGNVLGVCTRVGTRSSIQLAIFEAGCQVRAVYYPRDINCRTGGVTLTLSNGRCVALTDAVPATRIQLTHGYGDDVCPLLTYYNQAHEEPVSVEVYGDAACTDEPAATVVSSGRADLDACPNFPVCQGACCPQLRKEGVGCGVVATGVYEMEVITCDEGVMLRGMQFFSDETCTTPMLGTPRADSRANGMCIGGEVYDAGAAYDAVGCAAVETLAARTTAGSPRRRAGLVVPEDYAVLGFSLVGSETVIAAPTIYPSADCSGVGAPLLTNFRHDRSLPGELYAVLDACLLDPLLTGPVASVAIGVAEGCNVTASYFPGGRCEAGAVMPVALTPGACVELPTAGNTKRSIKLTHSLKTDAHFCEVVDAFAALAPGVTRYEASYAAPSCPESPASSETNAASGFPYVSCKREVRGSSRSLHTCHAGTVHTVEEAFTDSECMVRAAEPKVAYANGLCMPFGDSASFIVSNGEAFDALWCRVIEIMREAGKRYVAGIASPREFQAAGYPLYQRREAPPPTDAPATAAPVATNTPSTAAPSVPPAVDADNFDLTFELALERFTPQDVPLTLLVTTLKGIFGPSVTSVLISHICPSAACLGDACPETDAARVAAGCRVVDPQASAGRGVQALQAAVGVVVLFDVLPASAAAGAATSLKADIVAGEAGDLCQRVGCPKALSFNDTVAVADEELPALANVGTVDDNDGCSWCLPVFLIIAALVIVCIVILGCTRGGQEDAYDYDRDRRPRREMEHPR